MSSDETRTTFLGIIIFIVLMVVVSKCQEAREQQTIDEALQQTIHHIESEGRALHRAEEG